MFMSETNPYVNAFLCSNKFAEALSQVGDELLSLIGIKGPTI